VLDIPGGAGKVPVGPNYLEAATSPDVARYRIEDPCGGRHLYPPL
jgi:lysine 2,3-aminomutase